MDAPTCPFCARIASADLTDEVGLAVTFPDAFPLSPGHTLVVSKRHVASYFELTPEEQHAMWTLVAKVQRRLEEEFHPAGYHLGVNIGAVAGQTVGHAHAHVIPRFTGDVAEPLGGIAALLAARMGNRRRGG